MMGQCLSLYLLLKEQVVGVLLIVSTLPWLELDLTLTCGKAKKGEGGGEEEVGRYLFLFSFVG